MFGLADLKSTFRMTGIDIQCPVRGCDSTVTRARKGDVLRSRQFFCEACNIEPVSSPVRSKVRRRQETVDQPHISIGTIIFDELSQLIWSGR